MVSQKVVTPVKTGVRGFVTISIYWIPASAGMTKKGLLGLFARPSRFNREFFCYLPSVISGTPISNKNDAPSPYPKFWSYVGLKSLKLS